MLSPSPVLTPIRLFVFIVLDMYRIYDFHYDPDEDVGQLSFAFSSSGQFRLLGGGDDSSEGGGESKLSAGDDSGNPNAAAKKDDGDSKKQDSESFFKVGSVRIDPDLLMSVFELAPPDGGWFTGLRG